MTRRILGLAGAAALLASCDSTQPPIGCPIQSLEWSAVYTLQGTTDCTEVLPGEALGIQKFSTPTGDEQLSITPASLEMPPGHIAQTSYFAVQPFSRRSSSATIWVPGARAMASVRTLLQR